MSRLTFDEALMTLHGAGPVLDIAREISAILRDQRIHGAIVGGVAVGLHNHLRTTVDVDVFVSGDVRQLGSALEARGFSFDAANRQWTKSDVPVHAVTLAQLETAPQRIEEINGILTVSLADLITMKLRSGTRDMLRAQDLADVIGLIRANRLTSAFAPHIESSLRSEFRKLVDAIERESQS
jgi:hypothetical protein